MNNIKPSYYVCLECSNDQSFIGYGVATVEVVFDSQGNEIEVKEPVLKNLGAEVEKCAECGSENIEFEEGEIDQFRQDLAYRINYTLAEMLATHKEGVDEIFEEIVSYHGLTTAINKLLCLAKQDDEVGEDVRYSLSRAFVEAIEEVSGMHAQNQLEKYGLTIEEVEEFFAGNSYSHGPAEYTLNKEGRYVISGDCDSADAELCLDDFSNDQVIEDLILKVKQDTDETFANLVLPI